MAIQEVDKIWHNGKLVPWKEATTHVMTHALLYGTCAFEGIRAYKTDHKGTCIFRNKAHIDRLFYSAKVYYIDIPFTQQEILDAAAETVRVNGLESAYIRINANLGYGEVGPYSLDCPTDVSIVCFPWGRYLGDEAMAKGIKVGVSSWRRSAPGTIPAGVKAAGNYLSSRLITIEAKKRGYTEGIGLAHDGTVSEGAGENLFVVKGGRIITPPFAASILGGITRDSAITLARKLGYEVVEQNIPREMLYAADEIFLTGTAAEVTKVASVDDHQVGDGNYPISDKIQKTFFGLFTGETEDEWGWLEPIEK
ncbi:branched-chain amino acid transaminase [Parvularcula flava]|uniref:Branched-chain-amino-acid aminotransferase n=1 Tax=Aquisalinus luteolus TaxID=1566827 RepID=A0A8J3A651_9PROT|nr:branched-chain amino acid transaminase [Aquisalinus luteolus]NHK27650.1 branched-chain amino acid transaminase [Aquisalinus luteolus]GGH96083.1 branched chain amino acid aminotransferase [Aquisalinus luteolus]